MLYDVLIIGGGASGLAAAVMARRAGASRVGVLEKQPRVGKKLLATGNGRCNLTNLNARACDYAGAPEFAARVLGEFPPSRVLGFFESLGLMWRAGEGGGVYPFSNQASSVLDCLRLELKALGIDEICGFAAARVAPSGGVLRVTGEDGRVFEARRVIVCAGGRAAPKLGGGADFEKLLKPLKHTFAPQLPALTPLKTDTADIAGLKGIRHKCDIALHIDGREAACETGEILFTEYGVSGIAVMQLSGMAARALSDGARVELVINLLGMSAPEAEDFLTARAQALNGRAPDEFLTGTANKQLCQKIIRLTRAGADSASARVPSHYGDGGSKPPPYGDGGSKPPPYGDGGSKPPPYGDGVSKPPPYGDGGSKPPPYGDRGEIIQRAANFACSDTKAMRDAFSTDDIRALARALCAWRLTVRAAAGYESAQVMQGGARAAEFDARTMESKRVKGLYAAGELLDVTGPCGGYNLQWAWASGLLAGRSAAESL